MRQTQKPRIVNLLMLTVAGMINAFGITLFMTPVKLYDSGISGTSMLLEQITPSYLSLSLFLLILNVPLFLVGLKKQGGLFTFYAIYTVGIYSLVAWLITDIFPIDVSIASRSCDSLWRCDGWYRSYGGYFCKTCRRYSRNICYGI